MNLDKKVVLITGASEGIGRACAEEFAKQGSFLVIAGRNEQALREVKQKCIEIGVQGQNVLISVGDICDDSYCKRLFENIVKHFGKLDVFVQNAAIGIFGKLDECTMDHYDQIMRVNTRAPYLLTKLAKPHIEKSKGNIVYISSYLAFKTFPENCLYSMTKAALDHMARAVAIELGPKGVRVNMVNPGAILDTKIRERLGMTQEEVDKFALQCQRTYPLKRTGKSAEVAKTVVFLASDLATFTTGAIHVVDGGYSLVGAK